MGYRLRSNTDPAYTVATWIAPDGTLDALSARRADS